MLLSFQFKMFARFVPKTGTHYYGRARSRCHYSAPQAATGNKLRDVFYLTNDEPQKKQIAGEERTKVLVQMFEGHYFGELALIYGEPRNASVRATEEASEAVWQ